jgi:hypothetical protein
MITKDKDSEMKKLIHVINHAAKTYKKVSSTKLNDDVEYFLKTLAQHHQVFVKQISGKSTASKGIPVKNQLKRDDVTFNKKSAIDLLLLCIDIEKQILDHAREAVHSTNGSRKKMLCMQLTFSEKAIFEADQMLEEYE